MTRHLALAVSFALLFGALSVAAHHSASAAYDTASKITLKGKVTKVE